MADYMTQFSFALDVGDKENVDRAVEIYLDESLWLHLTDADEFADAGFFVSRHEDKLWISDGGMNGDVENVILYLKYIANELDLTGLVGFDYANTCSRPRIGGFGGGAHVLDLGTGQTVAWIDTNEWLQEQFAAKPTFWETLARRHGWVPLPCSGSSEGLQEPHLYNERLDRVWPLNDWPGACVDVGIVEHPTHTMLDWVSAVTAGYTLAGYDEWVSKKLADPDNANDEVTF